MQAQECPYHQEIDSSAGHSWGTDRSQPHCQVCGGLLGFCPDCRQPNRLLSRFCRKCGHAFAHDNWSLAGGEAESSLLGRSVSLPRDSARSEAGVASPGALLCERGLFLLLGARGELLAFLPPDREPVATEKQLLGIQDITHAPALLGGLMLLANQDRLSVFDLVEILRQSASPSRRRVLNVRGRICAPLASDGLSRLAVLSQEGSQFYLNAYQLQAGRIQLLWTQLLDSAGPTPSLCISGEHLLCLTGSILLYHFASGTPLARLQLAEPLSHHSPLARKWDGGPVFYVSGADGSLYRLWQDQQLNSVQIAPPCADPLFSWNAGRDDVILCHGRRLRRVELKTGRHSELELPQYCTLAPWVGQDRTLVLSQEGSLYAVSLNRQTFQVENSLKIEGLFHGAALPPVYAGNTLAVCDTQGRLTQVACGN